MFDKMRKGTNNTKICSMMMHRFGRRGIARTMLSLILTFSLVVGGLYVIPVNSFATGSTESSTTESSNQDNGTTDASIEKARQDAQEASKNKKAAQDILNKMKDAKYNLEMYIIQLDKELNEMQIEISHLEQTQKQLEESIAESEKNLKLAEAAQQNQYDEMKKRIQMVYEAGNKRYLDVLLTATSMTDVINKTEYVSQVSLYDYNILKELKNTREQVSNLKMKLDKDLESNQTLQQQVAEQKAEMESVVEEKNKQVSQYSDSIKDQEQVVSDYAKAEAEAEAIIAAAEQSASTSSNSTYTGGVFTWPVPGYNSISSYFGKRNSPTAGASSYHKGIDIPCSTGAAVVAASSGTVIVATYNAAEGNYVCIDHGGGVVTLYMHNSALNVSVGETVTAGQQIASAGSTGISTGPHLHFGVRVDGNYVDPLTYLQ